MNSGTAKQKQATKANTERVQPYSSRTHTIDVVIDLAPKVLRNNIKEWQ